MVLFHYGKNFDLTDALKGSRGPQRPLDYTLRIIELSILGERHNRSAFGTQERQQPPLPTQLLTKFSSASEQLCGIT